MRLALTQIKQIILSVKSGHTGSTYIRDLRGAIEREKAEMGVLLTLEPITKPMEKEAAEAGSFRSDFYDRSFARIQILTIEDLLSGKQIDYPRVVDSTFKKAPKSKSPKAEQLGLEV